MCLDIDDSVKSLSKRTVWKIFDKASGKIASLYMAAPYPKGKLVERSSGEPRWGNAGEHGLHFFTSKAIAKRNAKVWSESYIAKFRVDPKDFMYANADKSEAMYARATRVGNYIKVVGKE
jgi:hypothetical protein